MGGGGLHNLYYAIKQSTPSRYFRYLKTIKSMGVYPDSISHDTIRRAVFSVLLSKGKTIGMIEDAKGRKYEGDTSQVPYRNRSVWHNKRDLDYAVAEMLKLDHDSLLGPKRKSNEFSSYVTGVISKLRKEEKIADWSKAKRFGIFRVVDVSVMSKYEMPGISLRQRVSTKYNDSAVNINTLFLRILDGGNKDNTYKFALARALIEYCRDNSSDNLSIPYEYFADKFMRYYFYQEYKFHIRQNFRPQVPPRAIKILHKVFGSSAPGDIDLLETSQVDQARSLFLKGIFGHARSKTSLVIPRFQRIPEGNSTREVKKFYEYNDDDQVLVVRAEAFDFLSQNHRMLSKAVLVEWAKFLEKINPSLPLIIAKLERDDLKRGSLAKYRHLYLEHSSHCFYCCSRLGDGCIHVDHFIPWSYLFDDNAWNLVLACGRCNMRKSSSLPPREFCGSLISRNKKYYNIMHEMKISLDQLASGRGWEPEIVDQYDRCIDYGFGIIPMP